MYRICLTIGYESVIVGRLVTDSESLQQSSSPEFFVISADIRLDLLLILGHAHPLLLNGDCGSTRWLYTWMLSLMSVFGYLLVHTGRYLFEVTQKSILRGARALPDATCL